MDFIESNAKQNKDSLMRQISNTKWCGRERPRDGNIGMTTFWIKEDKRCPQIQLIFCKKCGNYYSRPQNHKIHCRC
jgi:hypothetical protein